MFPKRLAASAICILILTISLLPAGCAHKRMSQARLPFDTAPIPLENPALSSGDEPLPLSLSRQQLAQSIVESLQKPVMGRALSMVDVRRISVNVAPIVEAACRQPSLQPAFRQIARDQGISLDQARARWADLQDADLLLESGGDPDALSPAGAAGVAQWLPSTARAVRLSVSLSDSVRLTRKIEPLVTKAAWLAYLSSPNADLHPPGAPAISPSEARSELPAVLSQLVFLRAKRARLDTRYDPRQAIFAQTRYLIGLYNQIPSPDWIFQAYHGGVAGVERTLKKYLGADWPGSIQTALDSRRRLSVEDIYFTCAPHSHPETFAYVYDRGDDDRHYWWKLQAALSALALYKRDPVEFQREWQSLMPGRSQENAWYPDAPAQSFAELSSLKSAERSGVLVPVQNNAWYTVTPPPLDPSHALFYEVLRPQAKGALLLVSAAYIRAGGRTRLTIGALTQTQGYVKEERKKYREIVPHPSSSAPDPLLQAILLHAPPGDFDYHTTGLAFDIRHLSAPAQNRILLYALGLWKDRQVIWWREEDSPSGSAYYHIVPNPRFRKALSRISQTGHAPLWR